MPKTRTKNIVPDPAKGGLIKPEYLAKKPPRVSEVSANPLDGQRTAHRNSAAVDLNDPNRMTDHFHFYHAAHNLMDLENSYTVADDGIKIARPRSLGEQ